MNANLNNIDWNTEALGSFKVDGGWNVVRKTFDGQFAVISVDGDKKRIVKVLPTPHRARAYNAAISGQSL